MRYPGDVDQIPDELERTVIQMLGAPNEVYYQRLADGLWMVGWTRPDGVFVAARFNESFDGRWTLVPSM